ncbi:MAG: hypothetical protein A3I66_19090 [Burkholderiales bacterium RIFCSPLOWO2_02_FULL_57_36]|nr:MAG: hypothetical protein A3I66_19090 [Burkholderiales bacterium RIFCSPLOWO2_02_FULL_57_36]
MTQQPTTQPDAMPLPWVAVPAYTSVDDRSPLHLVGLRELVRWLMGAKTLGFMAASIVLHKGLLGLGDKLRLYITTHEPGPARAVKDSDTFGLSPSQRRVYSRGIDAPPPARQPALLPDGVTPGASAALYYVDKVWGGGRCPVSILDDASNPASCLAMPCDQAAAIWGGVATVAVVAVVPLTVELEPLTVDAIKEGKGKNKRGEWLPEAIELMTQSITAAKEKGEAVDSVAQRFGITRQAMEGAVKRAPEKKRKNQQRTTQYASDSIAQDPAFKSPAGRNAKAT